MSNGQRLHYGDHPSQWVDITVPPGGLAPVAVLIHGGFWKQQYGAEYAAPLVPSLVDRGWACAVVEYRRVGGDGGFPATLDDVAAAVDSLGQVPGLDLGTVIAVGHSAGGHLAAWLAGCADAAVPVTALVAQAAVLDLVQAAHDHLGGGAALTFMGGTPEQAPERYALANPSARLPLPVPVLCVHPRADDTVPATQSERFARANDAAGGTTEVRMVDGDHFAVIDPGGSAWAQTIEWMDHGRVS